MKKISYEYIKLSKDSVKNGVLQLQDEVTVTRRITSQDGNHSIEPNDFYKVVGFLPPEYEGGFIIDYNGNEWGFWFNGGMGEYFIKVEQEKEDEMGSRYGELPYKILKVLNTNNFLTVKELTSFLIINEMSIVPENLKKEKDNILRTIRYLESLGMIGVTKITKKDQVTYAITEKGRNYFKQ
jgi:hypothetical protein